MRLQAVYEDTQDLERNLSAMTVHSRVDRTRGVCSGPFVWRVHARGATGV